MVPKKDYPQLSGLGNENFDTILDENGSCQTEEDPGLEYELQDLEGHEVCIPITEENASSNGGESNNYEYTFDDENSVFIIGHKPNSRGKMEGRKKIGQIVVEGTAKKDIQKLLQSNSIDVDLKMGGIQVTELKDSGTINREMISYKAYIKHFINGMQVLDHKLVLGYFVDGEFQSCLMKWPEIAPKKHSLRETKSDTEIVDRVYLKLVDHPLGVSDEPLQVEPALRISKDGSLYQILKVSGYLKANFGKSFRSVVEVEI